MSEPVDERVVDRKDPLLALRRGWRYAPSLVEQREVERSEVDVERRQLKAQVISQASDRRSRATVRQDRHRAATVAPAADGSPHTATRISVWPSSATIAADLWPSPPSAARKQRESVRANDPSVRTLKHLQRGEIERISHPLQPVETAGIEPASAVA